MSAVTAAPSADSSASVPDSWSAQVEAGKTKPTRWGPRVRPHLPLIVLVGFGVALRLAFLIGYSPAFWFHGDSEAYLKLAQASELEPHQFRPLGYVVFLKVIAPTDNYLSVSVVQHLLGLALAVAVYALLVHRGVRPWLGCLAVAPLLLDALVLTLEHYLLADTLHMTLLAAAMLVLLWSPRPGFPAVALAGLLVAACWFVKPTALPIAVLVAAYLLVRRVGWRRVVTYGLAFVVPYLSVLVWLGDRPSVYGGQSALSLYGRTAIVADCDRLKLTDEQRIACPDDRWDRADAYYWRRPERLKQPDSEPIMISFGMEVLKQQPLDYLGVVGKETMAHFVPGVRLGPMNDCLLERLGPPEQFRDTTSVIGRCPPAQAASDGGQSATDPRTAPAGTALTRALHTFGEYGRSNPVVMSIALLLCLVAWLRGRRVDGRIRLDLLLLQAAGAGLTVLTVAIGMYEPRYALPALPLSAVAAALAWQGLLDRNRRSERGQHVPPTDPVQRSDPAALESAPARPGDRL